MGSEAIGALGAFMLVGVMAYFWLGRLKEKSPNGEFHDGDRGNNRSTLSNHYSLKLGMPEQQMSSNANMQVLSGNDASSSPTSAAPETETADDIEAVVDCPMAAANLDIAAKLTKIGDFEGVREIADLVIDSNEATFDQKAQARNLKRQCSPR